MPIPDPSIYPVIFNLSSRNSVWIAENSGPALIGIDGGSPMRYATIRFSGKYLLDFDQYAPSISAAPSGVPVVYELAPTSSDTASASVQLKVWTSTTKFHSYTSGSWSHFRQPSSSANSTHIVSVSESILAMSPVSVGGVGYYPKLSLSYSWVPFSDLATPASQGTANIGEDVQFVAMNAMDRGVAFAAFSWYPSWYYDRARTIPATSPLPAGLPPLSGSVHFQVPYSFGQDMYEDGAILSSGVASFGGVPRGDTAPLVEICYVQPDSSVLVSAVKFKQDGMPDQVGNVSSIYIVSGGYISSSSSFSSSSFSSSLSSSSSFSLSSSSLSSSSSSSSSSSDSVLTPVTLTGINAWPNSRGDEANAIDGDQGTYTWCTAPFNTGTNYVAVGFSSATDIKSVRLWKDNDGGGGANWKDLVILWTNSSVGTALSARTWQPVTNMVNGISGTELLVATSVNSDGTVVGDVHDSVNEGHGWGSLSFNEVAATGFAIQFSGSSYNHYKLHEIQVMTRS
jgi:hypothetical protein